MYLKSVLTALVLFPTLLSAQSTGAPDSLSYQGVLTDNVGTPVADGTYSLTFTLYDAATAGTVVWSETQSVTTSDGLYNTVLGRVTTLSDVSFDQPLWLGVKVGADPEMTPRTSLSSAPYAMSLRNLRVRPETSTEGPTLIGGYSGNTAANGVVGATIAGGGDPDVLGSPGPNEVSGDYGTVSGGRGNSATDTRATVSGGGFNDATNTDTTVGGGSNNSATGDAATVGGGFDNSAAGRSATVGGGEYNSAAGDAATVSGGSNNSAAGDNATVPGGGENSAAGRSATVPGGRDNSAAGDYSFAAGYKAKADHEGTFVWNDRSVTTGNDSLLSTGPNQFLIRAAGGVGIGTNAPDRELTLFDRDGNGDAFLNVKATNRELLLGVNDASGGIISMETNNDLRFRTDGTNRMIIRAGGNVEVIGTLSKGGGFFKIDHPLDPAHKYLYHSFVESPDMMNVYNGNVTTDARGEAWVTLPAYFEALNRDFRYQLTAIGAPGPGLYIAEEVAGNRFKIAGGTPGMKVSWQVTGIRQDPYARQNPIRVEVEKPAAERGTYLHPEAYRKQTDLTQRRQP